MGLRPTHRKWQTDCWTTEMCLWPIVCSYLRLKFLFLFFNTNVNNALTRHVGFKEPLGWLVGRAQASRPGIRTTPVRSFFPPQTIIYRREGNVRDGKMTLQVLSGYAKMAVGEIVLEGTCPGFSSPFDQGIVTHQQSTVPVVNVSCIEHCAQWGWIRCRLQLTPVIKQPAVYTEKGCVITPCQGNW